MATYDEELRGLRGSARRAAEEVATRVQRATLPTATVTSDPGPAPRPAPLPTATVTFDSGPQTTRGGNTPVPEGLRTRTPVPPAAPPLPTNYVDYDPGPQPRGLDPATAKTFGQRAGKVLRGAGRVAGGLTAPLAYMPAIQTGVEEYATSGDLARAGIAAAPEAAAATGGLAGAYAGARAGAQVPGPWPVKTAATLAGGAAGYYGGSELVDGLMGGADIPVAPQQGQLSEGVVQRDGQPPMLPPGGGLGAPISGDDPGARGYYGLANAGQDGMVDLIERDDNSGVPSFSNRRVAATDPRAQGLQQVTERTNVMPSSAVADLAAGLRPGTPGAAAPRGQMVRGLDGQTRFEEFEQLTPQQRQAQQDAFDSQLERLNNQEIETLVRRGRPSDLMQAASLRNQNRSAQEDRLARSELANRERVAQIGADATREAAGLRADATRGSTRDLLTAERLRLQEARDLRNADRDAGMDISAVSDRVAEDNAKSADAQLTNLLGTPNRETGEFELDPQRLQAWERRATSEVAPLMDQISRMTPAERQQALADPSVASMFRLDRSGMPVQVRDVRQWAPEQRARVAERLRIMERGQQLTAESPDFGLGTAAGGALGLLATRGRGNAGRAVGTLVGALTGGGTQAAASGSDTELPAGTFAQTPTAENIVSSDIGSDGSIIVRTSDGSQYSLDDYRTTGSGLNKRQNTEFRATMHAPIIEALRRSGKLTPEQYERATNRYLGAPRG